MSQATEPVQPPAGVIQITLSAEGRLSCQVAGNITRPQLLMMLETAKFDLERKFFQAEQPRIMAPPINGLPPFRR